MATISFITKIDLTLTPTQFVFTDSSDYAGQGIATSDVNGCFRIISPTGVTIYENLDFSNSGCDIKVSTSVIDQKTIPVTPELGNYTITYSVYDINTLETYESTVVLENLYVAPVIDIEQTVNVIASLYTQIDNTNYVVAGITPTMVRVNKLVYPAGIQGGAPAPLTTTSSILRTNVVYNGPATAIITNYVTYTFDDGLIVVANLFGSKVLLVDGAYYCSIMCGLKAYKNNLKVSDERLRATYEKNFTLACAYLTLVQGLIDCNGGSDISPSLEEIEKIIGECNCGCDDSDDNFSRIVGWGTIIGADGTDGVNGTNGATWLSGSGLPSGGSGSINDWYLDIATGNVYKKTAATVWTLELNIIGDTGPTGVDGMSILVNQQLSDPAVYQLGVNTPYTFTTYTLPINTLKANGDILELKCIAEIDLPTDSTWAVFPCYQPDINLTINATSLNPSISDASTGIDPAIPVLNIATHVEINAIITRLSATTVQVDFNVDESSSNKLKAANGCYAWRESVINVANLTTNTNVINVDVYANAVGAAAGEYWSIAIKQLLIKYGAI